MGIWLDRISATGIAIPMITNTFAYNADKAVLRASLIGGIENTVISFALARRH